MTLETLNRLNQAQLNRLSKKPLPPVDLTMEEVEEISRALDAKADPLGDVEAADETLHGFAALYLGF